MQPGEIYLASFPFGDTATMKLRPVLVLTPPVGNVPDFWSLISPLWFLPAF